MVHSAENKLNEQRSIGATGWIMTVLLVGVVVSGILLLRTTVGQEEEEALASSANSVGQPIADPASTPEESDAVAEPTIAAPASTFDSVNGGYRDGTLVASDLTLDTAAEWSTDIWLARVKSLGKPRLNTPDGQLPDDATTRAGGMPAVVRDIELTDVVSLVDKPDVEPGEGSGITDGTATLTVWGGELSLKLTEERANELGLFGGPDTESHEAQVRTDLTDKEREELLEELEATRKLQPITEIHFSDQPYDEVLEGSTIVVIVREQDRSGRQAFEPAVVSTSVWEVTDDGLTNRVPASFDGRTQEIILSSIEFIQRIDSVFSQQEVGQMRGRTCTSNPASKIDAIIKALIGDC